MSGDAPIAISALPEVLPIFPLEGALLLPHGHLPLHIFEPRYRALVEVSLGHGRVFGMVQPRSPHAGLTPDDAPLLAVGCAGRIVSFAETDDGRFLITLRGLCRFRVGDELEMQQGFRRIRPDFAAFVEDLAIEADEADIDRSTLVAAAKRYLRQRQITCEWQAVETASAAALITSLAMSCPFEASEKQALLECGDLRERGRLLVSLFEMAIAEGESPGPGARH